MSTAMHVNNYALSFHLDVYVTITEVVNVPEPGVNAVICIDTDITGNVDSALIVAIKVNNGLAGKTLLTADMHCALTD